MLTTIRFISLNLLMLFSLALSANAYAADVAKVGELRPSFSFESLEGEAINIDDYNGKVIILNFWATWCPPCIHEIPEFIELQEEYGEKGLQFIGVAIDDKSAVEAFADGVGINYPNVATEEEGVALAQRYGNSFGVLPYTVFIGRDGKVATIVKGGVSKAQVIKILDQLL